MRNRNIATKLLLLVLTLALVMPSGYIAYSVISEQGAPNVDGKNTAQQQPVEEQQNAAQPTGNVEISPEIQEIIRQSEPADFDKNLTNYKNLLVKLDVYTDFREEIERLLQEGNGLPDILIGYEFLNDSFGSVQDLEALIIEKESGKSWETVFEGYNSRNPEFVPGAFEQGYLEVLMNTPGITSDDIMLADRVAQKVSVSVSEVINQRIAGAAWKDINGKYGIVNAQRSIPHVPVTPEQIDRYTAGGLERQEVILAFVIAMKMDKNAEEVIGKFRAGESTEKIYAGYYSQKYD